MKHDELAETGKRSICGVCGYVGTLSDHIGQCPRCHWDELVSASPWDRDPVHETTDRKSPRKTGLLMRLRRDLKKASTMGL